MKRDLPLSRLTTTGLRLLVAAPALLLLLFSTESADAQQYKLRYEYQPGKIYKYKRVSEEQAYGELHANLAGSMDKRTESYFSYTGTKKDKQSLSIAFYQDTVYVQETPPPPDNSKAGQFDNILSQSKIVFDISTRGELQNVAIPESFTRKKNLQQYESAEKRLAQMGLYLPVLPEEPVSPGKTWVVTKADTLVPDTRMGKENSLRILTTTVTYTAAEIVKYEGKSCMKVTWDALVMNEEKQIERNQERFQEEKTTTTGAFYYALDEHILAGLEQQSQVESTMVLYGKDNGIIPFNQVSNVTITLQP